VSEFATWTGEAPEAAEAAPEAPGPGSWLPAGVQRRLAVEEQAERREARNAEQEQAERAEQSHDKALNAYRAAADARGEVVSAMALATGQGIGRSIGDVFADARLAAEREDGRAAAKQRREDGEVVFIDREPVLHGASRSAWPESEYELGRMVRQAEDDRSWMAGYQMRRASRQGRAAEHIEAQRAAAAQAHGRDQCPATRRAVGYYDAGEITRGTESAITGVW
jgi:hypothetical protein